MQREIEKFEEELSKDESINAQKLYKMVMEVIDDRVGAQHN